MKKKDLGQNMEMFLSILLDAAVRCDVKITIEHDVHETYLQITDGDDTVNLTDDDNIIDGIKEIMSDD